MKISLSSLHFLTMASGFIIYFVTSIARPGKDSKDANNYRPIALTSCVCKTMERMINDLLVWFLESSVLITEWLL